ncbi:MAG: hypothetical protein MUC81_10360 [Bacteroidia bacterium]|jgi:hypothetical protein|nr:hypothetical protein [Bacteroidia bacterium]
MIALEHNTLPYYEKELNNAQLPFNSLYRKLKSFNHFYSGFIRLGTKALAITFIILLTPIVLLVFLIFYFYLAHAQKEAVIIAGKVRALLPELSIDELKELKDVLAEILNKVNITREDLNEVSSFPTIIKPLAFSIKESLITFIELKESVEAEYNQSVKLLNNALNNEPNYTLID